MREDTAAIFVSMNEIMLMLKRKYVFLCYLFFTLSAAHAQQYSLKQAVEKGLQNYRSIRAKELLKNAAQETKQQVERDFWPNLTLSAQQDFGTINGQNGPLYGFGGLGVSSSGIPADQQIWHAAFGALYLVNVNWELYTFGRKKERVAVENSTIRQLQFDVEQEKFQQQIKIAAAYLNLLASHRLAANQQKNLERSLIFFNIAAAKVKNGLLPAVDSTLAAADVANAKISLFQAHENVKEQNNILAFLIGAAVEDIVVDTSFVYNDPKSLNLEKRRLNLERNPILRYQQSRIELGEQQLRLTKKEALPTLNVFGIYQARASGFQNNYAVDNQAFTRNYLDGIQPTRQNYLVGLGVNWNLTSIPRTNKKRDAQVLTNAALQEEYTLLELQFQSQLDAAEEKIKLALLSDEQGPKQVKAAAQAYKQKLVLYQNGLTTLLDVMQTQAILNRAETDKEILHINLWQSVLLKAAALGDFELFTNELQ